MSPSEERAESSDHFASAMEAVRPDRGLCVPQLREAVTRMEEGRLPAAEKLTQQFLAAHPRNIEGLQLMAEIATRLEDHVRAEALLARCLEIQPDSVPVRFAYANALLRVSNPAAARDQMEWLLARDPCNPVFRVLKPLVLEALGEFPEAVECWCELTKEYPSRVDCLLRYGYALRTVGARDECMRAFRKVIALAPSSGEAYWALANLKTFRFEDAAVAAIEAQLAGQHLEAASRVQMHFTLGKAYGDRQLYAESFGHYAKGNALQRMGLGHDPEIANSYVARCKSIFSSEFFEQRAGWGCQSGGPIFIVGMLRSGSTLVEQILASHSQVEGTRELFELAAIARELQNRLTRAGNGYPAALAEAEAGVFRDFGEMYLERVKPHRKLGRAFFTDKMGANYAYTGLLQLALPNAKIVDVRRHPLACGWSNFTQLFAKGQNFAYRLSDIGRLYRDYVELMAHFDRVLPGKVHRVFYERLVTNPQAEVRALLNYLGLPFEESCLSFHKTARAVTTISSEQVRRPIYSEALDGWRAYEPWLGSLKTALGPVLDAYPEAPAFR
ncbi:MAG: sulfotransferase [Alphaproteobacteria bacterium]|nr:sulfotransferase [Alphaproteobacteria bacterium]